MTRHTNTLRAAAYSLSVDIDLLAQVVPLLQQISQDKARALSQADFDGDLSHPVAIWITTAKPPEQK